MVKNEIRLGVAPLSGKINAGRAKVSGDNAFEFIGEFNDVTEDAIRTVAEYMLKKCDKNGVCEFWFKDFGRLTFAKE